MFSRIAFILGWLRRLGASRTDLLIENLALRQQLAVLTAKRTRSRMRASDRFFWLTLRRFWPPWKEALVVIRPDTVVCCTAPAILCAPFAALEPFAGKDRCYSATFRSPPVPESDRATGRRRARIPSNDSIVNRRTRRLGQSRPTDKPRDIRDYLVGPRQVTRSFCVEDVFEGRDAWGRWLPERHTSRTRSGSVGLAERRAFLMRDGWSGSSPREPPCYRR